MILSRTARNYQKAVGIDRGFASDGWKEEKEMTVAVRQRKSLQFKPGMLTRQAHSKQPNFFDLGLIECFMRNIQQKS